MTSKNRNPATGDRGARDTGSAAKQIRSRNSTLRHRHQPWSAAVGGTTSLDNGVRGLGVLGPDQPLALVEVDVAPARLAQLAAKRKRRTADIERGPAEGSAAP